DGDGDGDDDGGLSGAGGTGGGNGGDGEQGEDGGAGQAEGDDAGDPGARVYARSCALCHGGSGEGASGPALVGVADRLTVEQHLAVVRDGRGRMPAWADSLSPEEIEAVVAYERDVLGAG
ncbi:MAG TPA: cytochrome c, partial [Acidimicrobiales bacterium]|nr:cytochrome c [Acidimicrobiales bacterium]